MITLYSYPELFGVADNNGYGLNIETALKQFVVAHGNLVRHCGAIDDAVMAK